MFILTAFTFPISERGRGFHDRNKDLVSSNKGLKLTLNKSAYLHVTWTPKYRNWLLTTLNWNFEYEILNAAEFTGNNSLLEKFNL